MLRTVLWESYALDVDGDAADVKLRIAIPTDQCAALFKAVCTEEQFRGEILSEDISVGQVKVFFACPAATRDDL